MAEVSEERTGWRDEAISQRHRELWGFNCPAVDIDWLVIEYDLGEPVAIVEYKAHGARIPGEKDKNRRALSRLGDRAELPVFCVKYKTDWTGWCVWSWNDLARQTIPIMALMSELEYVSLLYQLRGRQLPPTVQEEILKSYKPNEGAAKTLV